MSAAGDACQGHGSCTSLAASGARSEDGCDSCISFASATNFCSRETVPLSLSIAAYPELGVSEVLTEKNFPSSDLSLG